MYVMLTNMRNPIHIVLILQVRDLYKDLVALEREFATKLQQLSRKAADKKAKKMAATVFGTTPTTPYDDKTLSQRYSYLHRLISHNALTMRLVPLNEPTISLLLL